MNLCAFVVSRYLAFPLSITAPKPANKSEADSDRGFVFIILVVTGLKLLNIAASGAFGKSPVNKCGPADKRPEFQTFMTTYLAGAISTQFSVTFVVFGQFLIGNPWKIAFLFHYAI
jgi:hypothetical protein